MERLSHPVGYAHGVKILALSFAILAACSAPAADAPTTTPAPPAAASEARAKPAACGDNLDECVAEAEKLLLEGVKNIAPAMAKLEAACNGGQPHGCMGMAHAERDGLSGKPVAAAVPWYRKACELGHGRGCGGVAALRFNAREITVEQAKALFQKGCDLGSGISCLSMVRILTPDTPAEIGEELRRRGLELLVAGCAREGRFCGDLGMFYLKGHAVAQDFERARDLFQNGCDDNDARSCYYLGQFFMAGAAVEKSLPRSQALFEKSCSGGHGVACTLRGVLEIDGKEPTDEESHAHGRTWFDRGCKLGDGRGCFLSTQNSKDASSESLLKSSERACQLRFPPGCHVAARMYLDGDGVEQSDVNALKMFEKACVGLRNGICSDNLCQQGLANCCHDAAMMYRTGRGTPVSQDKAIERYRVSCELGGPSESCRQAGMDN